MNRVIVRELKSIKLNVNNIHSSLINFNKRQVNLTSSITRFEDRAEKRRKLQSKEDKLESPLVSSLDNIKNTVKPSGDEGGGNIFDKLFEFIGLMLAGIIVNGLPAIIKKCKEIVDGITSFFAPIQSTFSLILAFLSGEIDKSDYDADKKRVNDGFDKLNRRGGLVDKMLDKTGPLKPLIKKLLSALNMGKSGKNVVLAKKGGKEGFYNKETKKFTERQWTAAERRSYQGDEVDEDVPAGNISTLVPKGGLKGLTDDDWKELAYIVSGEAQRGTDDEYGVAANVLTRVAHPRWPNNIRDVGRQRGQYEAVYTGKARYEPSLAQSLKDNQGKIADALRKLNGRDSFKGVSEYRNMGPGDVKFSPRKLFPLWKSEEKN